MQAKVAKSAILAMALAAVVLVYAEKQPFERYQSVVDRQMFGPLPKNFDPAKKPSEVAGTSRAAEKQLTQEQEQLKSAVHFSVINVEADGTIKVGFTDNADKEMPKSYYLAVGETMDEWTVNAADKDTATVTLSKGDIELELTLGGDSSKGAGNISKKDSAPQTNNSRSSLFGGGSIRNRRMMRMAAAEEERKREAAEKEEERARREEEKAERDAEREENRKRLDAIQEELKQAREEARAKKEKQNSDVGDAGN